MRHLTLAYFPPALCNFLAGISASASVTFLTEIVTQENSSSTLAWAALPWGSLAGLLVWSAVVLEGLREEARELADPALSESERRGQLRGLYLEKPRRVQIPLALSLASLVCAVAMMLAMFDSGDGERPAVGNSDSRTGQTGSQRRSPPKANANGRPLDDQTAPRTPAHASHPSN